LWEGRANAVTDKKRLTRSEREERMAELVEIIETAPPARRRSKRRRRRLILGMALAVLGAVVAGA
jgi:hypothetical protein